MEESIINLLPSFIDTDVWLLLLDVSFSRMFSFNVPLAFVLDKDRVSFSKLKIPGGDFFTSLVTVENPSVNQSDSKTAFESDYELFK